MNASSNDHHDSATIQLPAADGSKRSIPCVFHGMQGKRLVIEANEPIAISAALSIEHEDKLFLGETVTCAEQPGSIYRLEIKIEQILTGLQSLINLRAGLLGEGVPQPLTLLPVGVRN